MDRTSIIVLAICFVVLMLWYPLVVNKLYPPKPMPRGATNAAAPATISVTNQTGATTTTTTTSANISAEAPAFRPVANTNVPEEFLVVTNDDARYTFSSYGGGLKLVELTEYAEATSTRRQQHSFTNPVKLNLGTPVPTLALLDGDVLQGDGIFSLRNTPKGVRAEKVLTNGLSIVKNFEFESNYLLSATVRFENHTSTNLSVPPQEWVVGTSTPLGARDDGSAVGVLWYNGSKSADVGGATYFSTRGFACIPKTAPLEYKGGASNVFWVAAHNQFFALAVMPTNSGESLIVRRVDLPRPTGEEARFFSTSGPPPQGFEASVIYPAFTITQNQAVERQVYVYAGPKEYRTIAQISDRFSNNFDQLMGFGFFGFVSKALLLTMNWMHQTLRFSYGWAIVLITFLIKLIFWPLTASSTRSMKRMQALQPQLNALKEKYKEDPQKFQQKQWEFYKKNKVNPMGSCLPMFLQIPVFFGFLAMIRSAIELRGQPWMWVGDLSKPDTLAIIPGLGFIPFIGIPGVGLPFNLLPLIMGATMFFQARLAPPSPGMDPTQQAIMKYLPLIFLVGLYNFSAGLTLYWTVNNLLTIIQTKLTKNITVPVAPGPVKAPVLTPQPKKRK
ncbi:MAG TPA: membrane protein insertase YidC [Candidatus Dormibacteraeota bacterium]|nr:membrane protein insertase YidC [Candidatus Dormibacteraeota bacterium]